MKVGSFLFGSPLSASSVSKPISEIKANECNTKVYTPILYGNVVYFGFLAANALPKISSGGFANYYTTRRSVGFKFGSSKGVI